jgi:hypothetical protein
MIFLWGVSVVLLRNCHVTIGVVGGWFFPFADAFGATNL